MYYGPCGCTSRRRKKLTETIALYCVHAKVDPHSYSGKMRKDELQLFLVDKGFHATEEEIEEIIHACGGVRHDQAWFEQQAAALQSGYKSVKTHSHHRRRLSTLDLGSFKYASELENEIEKQLTGKVAGVHIGDLNAKGHALRKAL